jgi:hypothetical protein
MLGTMQATEYFTHLPRQDKRRLQLVVSDGAFWLLLPACLLDYKLRHVHTVVSQRLWSPVATSDAQRYDTVGLNEPIFSFRRIAR